MPLSSEVQKVIAFLTQKYGAPTDFGKSRLYKFGNALSCSVNYSKLLRGDKFFFGLATEVADPSYAYSTTECGDFVLLVCGSADAVLVLPRRLMLSMLRGVKTRKIDVFREGGDYILQTTGHPKLPVTEFLNAFPAAPMPRASDSAAISTAAAPTDRAHVTTQGALIALGRAEGCKVWVPPADRNLAFDDTPFTKITLERLPNFGFDEYTRRIVQNIDVLWLAGNVIQKAFEVESTTSIYSGLLRLNDLTIAQPNNRIDLIVVAKRQRRQQVYNQFLRPSFQLLASKCAFVSIEDIKEQAARLKSLDLGHGGRVTGLLNAERFIFPETAFYPSDV